jgi:hypothetical protein
VHVFVDRRILQWLEATKARTGLSLSEQMRRGVRTWLDRSDADLASGHAFLNKP